MRTDVFHHWLSQASELTPSQREQALVALSETRQFSELMAVIEQRSLSCPHCGHTHLIHLGQCSWSGALSLRSLSQNLQCTQRYTARPSAPT